MPMTRPTVTNDDLHLQHLQRPDREGRAAPSTPSYGLESRDRQHLQRGTRQSAATANGYGGAIYDDGGLSTIIGRHIHLPNGLGHRKRQRGRRRVRRRARRHLAAVALTGQHRHQRIRRRRQRGGRRAQHHGRHHHRQPGPLDQDGAQGPRWRCLRRRRDEHLGLDDQRQPRRHRWWWRLPRRRHGPDELHRSRTTPRTSGPGSTTTPATPSSRPPARPSWTTRRRVQPTPAVGST